MRSETNAEDRRELARRRLTVGVIMKAWDLRYAIEAAGTSPHFFTRTTMSFFGDTMRNYGVKDHGDYWELYRKRPVKHGLTSSHYFDKKTLRKVYPSTINSASAT